MSEPEQENIVHKGNGPVWEAELSEKAVDVMMAQHWESKWTEEGIHLDRRPKAECEHRKEGILVEE